jgi:hypothetical protein
VSITSAERPALEVFDAAGRGLRVTFIKDGDRFVHEIAAVGPRGPVALLAVELGREFDPWPRSPALQQLTLDALPGGRQVALLVGMAGKSHWSVSVEPQEPLGFCFDVACRMQRVPHWLGNSYVARQPIEVVSASAVGWMAGGVRGRLIGEALDGACRSRLEVADDRLAVVPQSQPPGLPGTVRWKYRVLLDK